MNEVDSFGLVEIILIALAVIVAMLVGRAIVRRRRRVARRRRTHPAGVGRPSDSP